MQRLPRAQPVPGVAQQQDDHPTSYTRVSLQITGNLGQKD